MTIALTIAQVISFGFALYFTTTLLHNWVLICSQLEVRFSKGTTVFTNVAGRFASFCWALFYLFYQLSSS